MAEQTNGSLCASIEASQPESLTAKPSVVEVQHLEEQLPPMLRSVLAEAHLNGGSLDEAGQELVKRLRRGYQWKTQDARALVSKLVEVYNRL